MIITLVVAASRNNAIGKDNKLLWHLPNDMKYFKNVTWGMPVIMGRKTFDALGKPLKGRKNIVITRQEDWSVQGVLTAKNFEEALTRAAETDAKEAMVIGGGQIYRSVIDQADRIHLTRIDAEFDNADTFFPEVDPSRWKIVSEKKHEADDRHAYKYSFQVWEKA